MIEFMFSDFWVFVGVTFLIVLIMAFILRFTALLILAYKGGTLSQETRELISKLAEIGGSTKDD